MVKLPRTPSAWNDQSAATPQEVPPSSSALEIRPGGLLDGWRSPAWSLENSGLSFVLHPQTIAQIDFGDRQGPHVVQAMAAGNLATGVDSAQARSAGHDNYNSAVFMTLPEVPLPSVISGASPRNKSAAAPAAKVIGGLGYMSDTLEGTVDTAMSFAKDGAHQVKGLIKGIGRAGNVLTAAEQALEAQADIEEHHANASTAGLGAAINALKVYGAAVAADAAAGAIMGEVAGGWPGAALGVAAGTAAGFSLKSPKETGKDVLRIMDSLFLDKQNRPSYR
ncbi:MAG TPA: hypothetical protein VJM78_02415 [Rhizomicrobium sp.]|nr:hypothetical protein [Rhizomicrobium sp.]